MSAKRTDLDLLRQSMKPGKPAATCSGQPQKDIPALDDPPEAAKAGKDKPKQTKRATVLKRHDRNIYRRAFSETQLLDLMYDEDFTDGTSYHFITGGDVDSLSFLKVILRQQDLEHCIFSTWCMASEDIFQMQGWLEAGKIKRLDAYVGEIFPNSYNLEWRLLCPIIQKHGGRVAVFRNHAKIFAGYGDKFAFGFQGSANINTNPRAENGCITIGREIYEFYREYFDGIISFVKPEDQPQEMLQLHE